MQLGMMTRSHRLWTWSRLEFCEDVLEETFEAVTWGLHSTRSNFGIADGIYIWSAYGSLEWYVISSSKSHGIASDCVSITDKDKPGEYHIINYYYTFITIKRIYKCVYHAIAVTISSEGWLGGVCTAMLLSSGSPKMSKNPATRALFGAFFVT